jgi:hypothetical protein
MSLLELIQRIYAIYPAPFNDGFVLAGQFMPELLRLFDRHMETIVPGHVIHYPWKRKMHCLKAALTYAIDHPNAQGYLGFGLYIGGRDATEKRWCYHAVCMESDGTVIDSSLSPYLCLFVGVKLGLEVYQALPKRPGAKSLRVEKLPPCLRTTVYANP